jgi:hypothetical protein
MIIRFVDIEGIINHHCLSFLSTNYLNAKVILTTYQQDMSETETQLPFNIYFSESFCVIS